MLKRAVVVAQIAERSPLIPEVRGSNAAIGIFSISNIKFELNFEKLFNSSFLTTLKKCQENY